MSLFADAQEVIARGTPNHLFALLSKCVKAKSAEALAATELLFEDMYGGFTFNYEMKAPAAYCLLSWELQGLRSLVHAAQRSPESKNISLTVEILSTLASGERVPQLRTWVRDRGLADQIIASVGDWTALFEEAGKLLHSVVLWFPTDDDAAEAIGRAFVRMSPIGPDINKALFVALSTRFRAVSAPTLKAYRTLISDYPNEETRFQEFLEQHPQLLDPMAFQVWPQPNLHGFKEPDFVVRRTDNSYVVVEIEVPGKPLVTAGNQVTAQVTQAVSQATGYKSFLMDRFPEAAKHFPEFREPECLVVIGLEESLNEMQRHALRLENQHRVGVRIVGFDWIALRAQAIAQNMTQSTVTIQKMRMV